MNLVFIAAACIAFIVTAALGLVLVPYLRRLKFGQTILDIGPNWHKQKEGTPTMGGIMFAIGITLAALVAYGMYGARMGGVEPVVRARFAGTLLLALGNSFIGFVDDYIKVVKKRNLGLRAREKLIMQFFTAMLFIAVLVLAGDSSTIVIVPFFGQLDLGVAYYPLAVLGIVYIVNSVNFADGLDGLASSVTFIVAFGMMLVSLLLSYNLNAALAAALAGGCVGFLIWNFYPARVFMGDTGSMYLGGMVTGLAFGVGIPLIIVPLGIIYIVESLSVMIQMTYFKITGGRRIFKMTPIHHHYEMKGHSEVRIVVTFTLVTLVGALVAVLAVSSI